ncbi:MAG: protein kinase domain-containing protein [Vicinamibacterales bacterium]
MIVRPAVLDVAAALADGAPVDWDSAAQSAASEEDRRVLEELRFIAQIARPFVDTSSSLSDVASVSEPAPTVDGEQAEFWGPLRLLEHVGRGSFGDVYRAWDTRLDREVALKLLRRSDHDDARASTVIQEGRLLARVRHPNVVTVYGAARIDGQVGVWMEFIHGKTLEHELREGGPFDVERVIGIGIDLADALITVHGAGLVHGDVKTHNVMCSSDGRTVLTDFGAGFELDETVIPQSRDLAGTPVCIAPEVFAGRPGTSASDVYSLGVLLYHLVTGTYPVRGSSVREIREAHAAGVRTPLVFERPDLPREFVRVVDRALDPNPDDRYPSPAALRTELTTLRAADASVSATTRRNSRLSLAAAVVIVSASVAVALGWFRSETPTIAVMPFHNLSADPSGEHFVDGLTDEIIRNLSVIDGLEVRSRTSSFVFKGKPRNLRDVAQQLHAGLVVEGSVLLSDGRLRINAQLIRAKDDVPIWAQSFDRQLKDVFAIQDEISRSIVNELRLTLGRGQRRYNTNLEAYELYLRARAHGSPVEPAQGRIAADLFQQVIDKDPSFAPAYAGLADAWAAMSINRGDAAVRPVEAFAAMKPAAERALQLDPRLAEAHAAMGVVLARDRKWAQAEAAFRRAVELNGNLSSIRMNFVRSTLWPQGKVDQSVSQVRTALRRDPLSVEVQALLAHVLVSAGLYEESIEIGRRIVPSAAAANDGRNHSRQVLARALFQDGDRAEAVQRFEQLGSGSDNFRGYAYAVIGRHAEARALAAQRQNFPASLVLIHAGLGETDRAFEALERMAAEQDPRVGMYLTYPELASLRKDPRMNALRQRLGLPSS